MDKKLMDCRCNIDTFRKRFTFVTDCAATIPAVFWASVSPNKVPFSETWISGIDHQRNTAMKKGYDEVSEQSIKDDIDKLKKMIRIFKKSGLKEKLPPGKASKQEPVNKVWKNLWYGWAITTLFSRCDSYRRVNRSRIRQICKCCIWLHQMRQFYIFITSNNRHMLCTNKACTNNAGSGRNPYYYAYYTSARRYQEETAYDYEWSSSRSVVLTGFIGRSGISIIQIVCSRIYFTAWIVGWGLFATSWSSNIGVCSNTSMQIELMAKGKRLLKSMFNKAVRLESSHSSTNETCVIFINIHCSSWHNTWK